MEEIELPDVIEEASVGEDNVVSENMSAVASRAPESVADDVPVDDGT
jgi:hypothetical protein